MKSSVRILAIVLALAFLLLARTAFQDDTTASAADDIELKDGEATFADLIDGTIEASYLGFGVGATTTVYFYIESEDLGTQVTASAVVSDGDTATSSDGVIARSASGNVLTLQGSRDVSSTTLHHAVYTYGSDDDPFSEINPNLRYTYGADGRSTGGALRPLAGTAKVTEVDTGGTSTTTRVLPNAITGDESGQITSLLDIGTLGTTGDSLSVSFTFDIVDVYEANDAATTTTDYEDYTSGFGRAYVSSGSDSGQWVEISEVAAVKADHNADGSPTSNLFRGSVTITNDTTHEDDQTIYAQDGDTLTLQVFDENGERSSDVLASAVALIDDSPPTITDLSPADETVTNDDTLRISFNVNDEGAGADFRNIENVVTMVQAQARDDEGEGTGTSCPLVSSADIDNAGGNSSSVGVLIAPSGGKFSDCSVVDTTILSANSHGEKFNLIITAQDLAGNVTTHTTQLTIDTVDPIVVSNPKAGQAWDADDNEPSSSQDSILVEFNESLDVDTVAVADFTVAGYTIDSAEVVGTNEEDGDQNLNKYVVLTLTEDLAKNARPSVTVTGVSDVAGNSIEGTTTRTSDNKINAAITVVPFSALLAKDGEQAISFTSDEALRSQGGGNSTVASVNGDLG